MTQREHEELMIPPWRPPRPSRPLSAEEEAQVARWRAELEREPIIDVDCVDERGRWYSDESASANVTGSPQRSPAISRFLIRISDFTDWVRSLEPDLPRGWWLCLAITLPATVMYVWRLTAGVSGWVRLLGAIEFFVFYGFIGAVIAAGFLFAAIYVFCRLVAKVAPWFEL